MTLTRRNFLRAGSMVALAGALPLSLTQIARGQKRSTAAPNVEGQSALPLEVNQSDPLYFYTRQTFVPYINSTFRVNSVPLNSIVLIEVNETPLVVDRNSPTTPTGENFTLVFSGSNRTPFTQNTYTVEHAALGKFDLFLVPTGLTGRQQLYVATINRRI